MSPTPVMVLGMSGMPRPDDLLASLQTAALSSMPLAMAWHVLVLFAVVSLSSHWRPSQRLEALALVGPLATSSGVAFTFGNAFNGVLLAVVSLGLFFLAGKAPTTAVKLRRDWVRFLGYALVLFGFFYPHFLAPHPAGIYMLAAPVGVLPCPSLALVIGAALLIDGFEARSFSLVLAATGLFFGLFGALHLGVTMDLVLALGAGALAAVALAGHPAASHVARPS